MEGTGELATFGVDKPTAPDAVSGGTASGTGNAFRQGQNRLFSEVTEQDFIQLGAFHVDVEQAALGAILVENKLIALFEGSCKATDFYDPLHQRIAERIFAKFAAGRPVTPLTIWAAMTNDKPLKEIGGRGYLIDLAAAAPALADVVDLGRTLAEARIRRDAIVAMFDAHESMRAGEPLDDALSGLSLVVENEAERLQRLEGTTDAYEIGSLVIRETEQAKPDEFGVRTGIGSLDALIGGLYPGQLIIGGGRPGMGKSILGTTFALNTAAAIIPHEPHYYSLEMSGAQLAARMLTDLDYDAALKDGIAPIQYSDVERRNLKAAQIERLMHANYRLRELGIRVHDMGHAPATLIARMLRVAVARSKKPVVAIIDHMGIIDPEPNQRGEFRRVDHITFITRLFKRLAKELHIPIVLLSQLNRELEGREDKRPVMADFRDSGSIEQDSDILIGVNRPAAYLHRTKPPKNRSAEQKNEWQEQLDRSKGLLQLGVLKNRMGNIGDVECFIDPATSAIRNESPDKPVSAQLPLGLSNDPLDVFTRGDPRPEPPPIEDM